MVKPLRQATNEYAPSLSPAPPQKHRYLTRGMGSICGVRAEPKYSWPTCELHYDLTIDYTDFYSWVWTSLYSPHGPVHVWLGGVLDCSETYAKLTKLVGPYIS
ncbi:unnamed protein product, partial [Sphacelaria rigidula]